MIFRCQDTFVLLRRLIFRFFLRFSVTCQNHVLIWRILFFQILKNNYHSNTKYVNKLTLKTDLNWTSCIILRNLVPPVSKTFSRRTTSQNLKLKWIELSWIAIKNASKILYIRLFLVKSDIHPFHRRSNFKVLDSLL